MATLGNLVVQIGAATKDLDAGLEKAAKKLEKWGKSISRDARDLGTVLTVPIAGFAAAAFASSEKATKAFKDFADRTKTTFGKFGDEIAKAINLEELLKGVSDKFEELFKWFNSLDDSTKKTIITIAALAAAIAPLILLLGSLAQAIAAIEVLLTGPVGIAIALAAVVAGFIVYENITGNSTDASKDLTDALNKQAGSFNELEAAAKSAGATIDESGDLIFKSREAALKFVMESFLPKDRSTKRFEPATEGPDRGGNGLPGESASRSQEQIAEMNARRDIQEKLNASLARSALLHANLGERFDANAAKTSAFTEALTSAADLGLGPIDDQVQAIMASFDQFTNETAPTFADSVNATIENLKNNAITVGEIISSLFQQVTQGIGDSIATAIVYGESLGALFQSLFKSILASLIAFVIQAILQWTILAVAERLLGVKKLTGEIGQATGTAAAWAAAASVKELGLIGIAAAPAFAAAAAAITSGAGASGYALGAGVGASVSAAATGGMFETPTITSIAERGPEIVLNKRNVEEFFGGAMPGAGGRAQHIGVYLDGRSIMNYVVRGMPDMLRLHGAA